MIFKGSYTRGYREGKVEVYEMLKRCHIDNAQNFAQGRVNSFITSISMLTQELGKELGLYGKRTDGKGNIIEEEK